MTRVDKDRFRLAITRYLDSIRKDLIAGDPQENDRTSDVTILAGDSLVRAVLAHAEGELKNNNDAFDVLGTTFQMGFYYGRSYEQLEQEEKRAAENDTKVPKWEQRDRIGG